MGTVHENKPALLFVGILTSLPELLPRVEEALKLRFGNVGARSAVFQFDSTHYYDEEMGSPIVRQFIALDGLFDPESLPAVKRATNELEGAFAGEALAAGDCRVRRPVNLDPGYLDEAKIVLASTKDFMHRILLSRGIYAEVTLHFERGEWRAFPWTFPDFRTGRYLPFFGDLRRVHRARIGRPV
jgi:hypothetical protein